MQSELEDAIKQLKKVESELSSDAESDTNKVYIEKLKVTVLIINRWHPGIRSW